MTPEHLAAFVSYGGRLLHPPALDVAALVALGQRLLADAPAPLSLAPLVELGTRLRQHDQADLHRFVEHVVRTPDRLRVLWYGNLALQRLRLDEPGRRMLDVLGRAPDLFGPARRRHDERLHTETMAWAMSRSPFARRATRAFLERALQGEPLLGAECPPEFDALNAQWSVLSERAVPPHGRVDLWLRAGESTVVVEIKIDAAEGKDQVLRYNRAQARHGGDSDWVVVFLTLRGDAEPSGPALGISLRDVLQAWLPIAAETNSGAHRHLAGYLASCARLLSIGAEGSYDDWTIAARRSALALIEPLREGDTQ